MIPFFFYAYKFQSLISYLSITNKLSIYQPFPSIHLTIHPSIYLSIIHSFLNLSFFYKFNSIPYLLN